MTGLVDIAKVYEGSDGEATKALYAELEAKGTVGVVAVNLFRACKCSERAKVYRGRSYKDSAYGRKQWSLENLCKVLEGHAAELGIAWGWGIDAVALAEGGPHYHVLYLEIPTGQVSFHTDVRATGPAYTKEWDGARKMGPGRVCNWVYHILNPEMTTLWSSPRDLTSWNVDPTTGSVDAADPEEGPPFS
jgi:hypothetical protein